MKVFRPDSAALVARLLLSLGCSTVVVLVGSCVVAQDHLDRLAGNSIIPFSKSAPEAATQHLAVETVEKGSSSRFQRRDAIDELPLKLIDAQGRAKVQNVLDSISLYRRLPTTQVEVDPRVYSYFSDNPDVAVSIWRAMQISRVQLRRVSETEFETDTQDGTCGKVAILHRSPTSQLVYCEGQFQSPALPKPIIAVALMHLQTRSDDMTAGASKITHSVDLFVSFPSQAVETVAKIVSPVSNRIADRNFEEISLFLELMHGAMSRQPGWVEQLAGRMDGISVSSKDELLKTTAAVYVDAQRRLQEQSGVPVSIEAIRAPVRTATNPAPTTR